jgi:deazaflavin-dependent oxidoreductase (nitroreductase family)
MSNMSDTRYVPTSPTSPAARIPPRWVVRGAWKIHRAIYKVTGGRRGLTRPRPGHYGMLRLRTIGRTSGVERAVIVAYYLDGDRFVTIAMNGWADAHPAWLLNLRAHPEATVDLVDGTRKVVAREAHGDERQRLWDGYANYSSGLDDYATLRKTEAPVVILEPTPEAG